MEIEASSLEKVKPKVVSFPRELGGLSVGQGALVVFSCFRMETRGFGA